MPFDTQPNNQFDGGSGMTPPPPPPNHFISVTNEGKPNAEYHTNYEQKFLSKKIDIKITADSSEKVKELSRKLESMVDIINNSSKYLSKSQRKIIEGITAITVNDLARTGIDSSTGVYNMRSPYIMASSSVWGASTIAHDSYHVYQRDQGYYYNNLTAPRMEWEANQFQIQVGQKFGLSQSEINYIRNDQHTLYNTHGY